MNNAESIKTKSILFTLFLGVVLGATFATGFLAWITFESTDELAELQDRHKEIVSLQGIVTHYDEVLTMSARMAAATGDMKWERRYRQFESVLDQTIKKLISLQPNETSSVKATDEANAELVKMENEALLLVKKIKRKRLSKFCSVLNMKSRKKSTPKVQKSLIGILLSS